MRIPPPRIPRSTSRALFRLETQRQHNSLSGSFYKKKLNQYSEPARGRFRCRINRAFYADALNPEEKVVGHFV